MKIGFNKALQQPKLGNIAWRTCKPTTGSMLSSRSSMPSTVLRLELMECFEWWV